MELLQLPALSKSTLVMNTNQEKTATTNFDVYHLDLSNAAAEIAVLDAEVKQMAEQGLQTKMQKLYLINEDEEEEVVKEIDELD